jgi:hypothetical protein
MGFRDELAFGKVGESKIANWLRYGRRFCVMPVYEIGENQYKGPQLFTPEGELIAPDIFCFNKERAVWVEAKHKTVFSWHRNSKRWVTGIDLHHYEHYLKSLACSRWPVWLLFYHANGLTHEHDGRSPTGLFGGDLRNLRDNENHRHENWGKCGMVYWSHDVLKRLATCEEVENCSRKGPHDGRPIHGPRRAEPHTDA